MTSPRFIEWLDDKMAEHDGQKVVPPGDVAGAEFAEGLEAHVRAELSADILRQARIDDQVRERIAALEVPDDEELVLRIETALEMAPDTHWRDHIAALAREAAHDVP
jgi:hypothetical protein